MHSSWRGTLNPKPSCFLRVGRLHRWRGIPWVAAWLLTGLAASAAGLPEIESRLAALESQLQELRAENSALRRQVEDRRTGLPSVVPQPGGRESRLVVGGFLQPQAEFGAASDSRWRGTNDRIFFRRARLYLAGAIAEDFEFKAELDLQGNSLGAGTGLHARANEIYVLWRRFDAAQFRVGQLKPSFGAEALGSDLKTATIERALASDRLVDGRQLAAGLSGALWGQQLRYSMVLANGTGSNSSANDNSKFQRSARLDWSTAAGVEGARWTVGLNGLWSEDRQLVKPDLGFTGQLFSGRRTMSGVDARLQLGRGEIAAEWLQGRFEPVDRWPHARIKASGWHVTGSYFVLLNKLQFVARYEEFAPDDRMPGRDYTASTVGLNYLIFGDDLKLMFNYRRSHLPDDEGRFLTRLQLVF